jgi:DNA-binding GntR family transcriptional regulator
MDQDDEDQKDVARPARGLGARHVYDTLRHEILTLALAPGAALDETSLAERFGLSRSPVREALVRLSADGLVSMLSNRASLVAPIDIAGFPRYVEALDLLQRINTRLAAQNRTEADLAAMAAAARAFDAACRADDHLAMSATNRDFHMAVARAGRNPYLARAYGQLLDEGRRILHLHFEYLRSSATEQPLASDHDRMIDAIRARDIDLADRLAHDHTRLFHDRFLAFLGAQYQDDFRFAAPADPAAKAATG